MQKKFCGGKVLGAFPRPQPGLRGKLSGHDRREALEFADFDREPYKMRRDFQRNTKPWISLMRHEPLSQAKKYRLSENQLGIPNQKWRKHIKELQSKVYEGEVEYQEQRRQRAIERLFEKLHGENNTEINK